MGTRGMCSCCQSTLCLGKCRKNIANPAKVLTETLIGSSPRIVAVVMYSHSSRIC